MWCRKLRKDDIVFVISDLNVNVDFDNNFYGMGRHDLGDHSNGRSFVHFRNFHRYKVRGLEFWQTSTWHSRVASSSNIEIIFTSSSKHFRWPAASQRLSKSSVATVLNFQVIAAFVDIAEILFCCYFHRCCIFLSNWLLASTKLVRDRCRSRSKDVFLQCLY